METFPIIILGIYGLAGLTIGGLLIYLGIRRFKIRDRENFEKRDN